MPQGEPLAVSAEATIIEKIEEVKKIALAMIPQGKKQKEADDPYYNELDDEGQKQVGLFSSLR